MWDEDGVLVGNNLLPDPHELSRVKVAASMEHEAGEGLMAVRQLEPGAEALSLSLSVSPCLSLSLPVSPCLSLSLPVSPCLSLSLPVSPCLSSHFPISLYTHSLSHVLVVMTRSKELKTSRSILMLNPDSFSEDLMRSSYLTMPVCFALLQSSWGCLSAYVGQQLVQCAG